MDKTLDWLRQKIEDNDPKTSGMRGASRLSEAIEGMETGGMVFGMVLPPDVRMKIAPHLKRARSLLEAYEQRLASIETAAAQAKTDRSLGLDHPFAWQELDLHKDALLRLAQTNPEAYIARLQPPALTRSFTRDEIGAWKAGVRSYLRSMSEEERETHFHAAFVHMGGALSRLRIRHRVGVSETSINEIELTRGETDLEAFASIREWAVSFTARHALSAVETRVEGIEQSPKEISSVGGYRASAKAQEMSLGERLEAAFTYARGAKLAEIHHTLREPTREETAYGRRDGDPVPGANLVRLEFRRAHEVITIPFAPLPYAASGEVEAWIAEASRWKGTFGPAEE